MRDLESTNGTYLNRRKVAGILAEARDGRVILGIGVNVNTDPDQLPAEVTTPATSLLAELGLAAPLRQTA